MPDPSTTSPTECGLVVLPKASATIYTARLWRIAAAALALAGGSPAALAQADNVRDRLVELATIEVTSDLCHIDLSDEQTERIAAIRNTMLDEGTATAADISDIHDQIAGTMERQVSEGLCKPDGPGMRFFKAKLATLGVL